MAPGHCNHRAEVCGEVLLIRPRRGELPLAVYRALVYSRKPDMGLCAGHGFRLGWASPACQDGEGSSSWMQCNTSHIPRRRGRGWGWAVGFRAGTR